MKRDITKIRGEETCRSIVGYDANALYLWALMQDMPTGWYTRRREERQFRPQQAQPFGQMAVQWLTWEAAKNGCAIRHQVNGREKADRQTSGRWVVSENAHRISISRLFLLRLSEMLRPK